MPTMKTYEDAKKLLHPELIINEKKSKKQLNLAQDLLGDILAVQQKGITRNACHLTLLFSGWRGLQQICIDMIEAPIWVHEIMAFISEGLVNLWKQSTNTPSALTSGPKLLERKQTKSAENHITAKETIQKNDFAMGAKDDRQTPTGIGCICRSYPCYDSLDDDQFQSLDRGSS